MKNENERKKIYYRIIEVKLKKIQRKKQKSYTIKRKKQRTDEEEINIKQ